MKPVVLAITGASGAAYGLRLLQVLAASGRPVHLTISPAATEVFRAELGIGVDLDAFQPRQLLAEAQSRFSKPTPQPMTAEAFDDAVTYHHFRDYAAGIASGSFLTEGMVICPCSMDTLASLSHGMGSNLIHRAAAVHLKERRKLIVVPRETPLSAIQLGNMTRLAEAGAIVLPAMPGFYHGPATIDDLIDFIVARVCDQLGVEHGLMQRWGESQ
ncbi:MAG: UbiX family flavin prenyltransferase [Planctomycetota bacterium]|nr:UbiX family flavin prenyltransferase [Planctomycetaceae bacterium]MDQ3332353.1 UbiX family flavin prenyltransferase [Planctomycetota bacterium]